MAKESGRQSGAKVNISINTTFNVVPKHFINLLFLI